MIILAGVLIAWGMGISYSADWQISTVESDPEANWYDNVSMQLDDEDRPCIAYTYHWEYEHPYDDIKYAHWTGNGWDIDYINTVGTCYETSLALDSRNYPLIAYTCLNWTKSKQDGPLVLITWTGAGWDIQDVCWELEPLWETTSLAVDNLDHPQLGFTCYEDSPSPGLTYAQWTGSIWDTQVVDTDMFWGNLSIALDSQDNPHIAYVNDDTDELKYAELLEGSWSIQVLASFSYYPVSLALDGQGFPHIAYGHNSINYCYWDGASWVFETIDNGNNPCLALDSLDNPHIAYTNSASTLKYAHKSGDNWEIVSFDDTQSDNLSLVLDSQDYPHICFSDYALNALRYLWYGEPFDAISLQSFTAKYVGKEIVVNWTVSGDTFGEDIAGFDLYRREANIVAEVSSLRQSEARLRIKKQDIGWTKVNNSLITGDNPYTYSDNSVDSGKTYEYRLEAVLTDESTEILGTTSCATNPPSFAITALYPNPASDLLNLTLSAVQAGAVTLALYDLSGRLVESQMVPADSAGEMKVKMDVSALSAGVYTLRATQEEAEAVARVVVVR